MKISALLPLTLLLSCTFLRADGFDPRRFSEPDSMFSPGYFWMWNAKLDVAKLNAQLDDMVAHGVRSVCIHPFPKNFRPDKFQTDMSPDYLTPEYFLVFSNVVDHIAALGMSTWLYDEGGWPSGGACGLVAASDREGRFRQLFYGRENPGSAGPNGLWRKSYGEGKDNLPSVLEPGATERFIALTHEAYARHVGRHFGKTIKFTFMDEPEIPHYAANSIGWASDFRQRFMEMKGYDIMRYADDLIACRGTVRNDLTCPRQDYNDVMGRLYVERFHDRIRDWCRRNNLKSSGHMNGDDRPEFARTYGQGSLMRCLRALDVPGVDVIWRQLYPTTYFNPGAQPPFPRYASSVANQKGEPLALSESFGIYGDSFDPLTMKWLADYQMVRGINLFVLGYYAVSNDGQWMLLFEPHSGPVTPWWDFIRPYFDYVSRISSLMASGKPVTETAVYFDERAFWTGGADTENAGTMHYAVAKALDRANCEYDFVEDEALAAATVENGRLKVGRMSYSTFVLPTRKWMSEKAKANLTEFKRTGGRVLGPDETGEAPPACRIDHRAASGLRVAKRVCGGDTLYFIVNESAWNVRNARLSFDEKGKVVQADAETGRFVDTGARGGSLVWTFPPYSSAVFVVGNVAPDEPRRPEFRDYDGFVPPVTVSEGWSLRPIVRHRAGKTRFEIEKLDRKPVPVALGDWRETLGYDFSGKAIYTAEFDCDADGEMWLDLGKVNWACSVRLNGKDVGVKFFGPYRWRVRPAKGRNVIEVTVANMLCNALDDKVRERIAREYPPNWGYEIRHSVFDRENNASGLLGPVTLR